MYEGAITMATHQNLLTVITMNINMGHMFSRMSSPFLSGCQFCLFVFDGSYIYNANTGNEMLRGAFAFTGGNSWQKTQMTSHGKALFVFTSCCWESFSHLTTHTYPKWADSNIWSLEERKISDHKENSRTTLLHTCAFPCVSKTHLRSQRDKGLFVSNDA